MPRGGKTNKQNAGLWGAQQEVVVTKKNGKNKEKGTPGPNAPVKHFRSTRKVGIPFFSFPSFFLRLLFSWLIESESSFFLFLPHFLILWWVGSRLRA